MIVLYAALGAALGLVLGFILYRWYKGLILRQARVEALELIEEAQGLLEEAEIAYREKFTELEDKMWSLIEKDLLKSEERIEALESDIESAKTKLDTWTEENRRNTQSKQDQVRDKERKFQSLNDRLRAKQKQRETLRQDWALQLAEKLGQPVDKIKTEIIDRLVVETQTFVQKQIELEDENFKSRLPNKLRQVMDVALDRFARPYSAERGIGAVYFTDPNIKKLFLSQEKTLVPAIQDACGCDIIVDENNDLIGVAGFDPVRRELTRRTLEKILKDKRNVHADQVKRIAENQKRELFAQIKKDGDNIAKELKLEGLHPEVRKMMGSLRYRYSFTQNQYFHCGEVGWLCGLLAAELGLDVKKARRSGMLHDIGKAMDHAIEGGHAVIGADFIQGRGEAADIVHNVRAHHYDEQPSSDMAFLVIAADAISGARPGARRSTIESYNQKVNDLQDIARRFDGVTDCFILNGGRECRVLVNGKKVTDMDALNLSKKIAATIEEEVSYPGHIKVVVVRETSVAESTTPHR